MHCGKIFVRLGSIALRVILVVLLTGSCCARSQSADTKSAVGKTSISGLVTDTLGKGLAGVSIAASVSSQQNHPVTGTSNSNGTYELSGLSPGTYAVTFSLTGFQSLTREEVKIGSNGSVTLDAELSLASLNETVIVTAREREEDIQRVPQSIAAYSAEDLGAESVGRLSDLGQVAPNFLYGQKVQSGSSAGQIYIRGIGQQDTNVQFSSGVGVYVDGVFLGRAQANDLEMADVERVEILYGPQGTLFGKNSDGGALNIITEMPNLAGSKSSKSAALEYGSYGRVDLKGLWNAALIPNKLGLLVSAAGWRQEGYSLRLLDDQRSGNQNRAAGRAKLLWRPKPNLDALLSADGTIFDERSAAYRLVEVRTTSPIPMLYASATPYRYDNEWVTRSDFQYNGTGPNKDAGNVWGTSFTLNWEKPWGNLKSITAFRKMHVDSEFDPDGSPLTILDVFNYIDQHQFSEEIQATGTSLKSRVRWVSGLYYFREKAKDIQPVNIALELFHGAANLSYNNYVVNQNPALYGQTTMALTSKLNLTAGARLAEDLVGAQREQVGYPVPAVQQPLVSHAANWTSFLPRVGLDYQWTPQLMAYVSASEGEKSGGYNGRASSAGEFTRFNPEKVWAYEVGLRSEWFNQRVRLNATGYYSDYRDFQIQVNRTISDPVTGLPVAYSYVGNMPKTTIKGGEVSLTTVPLPSLLLSAGLGIIDGKYVETSAGAPVTTKSQLVNAPKCTLTLGMEHSASLHGTGQLTARLDLVHKSTIQYDYGNSPLVAQAPYSLLNAKLAWQRAESRFSVYGFGTDLNNAHYAVGGLDDGPNGSLGEVIKMMGVPREWGMGGQFRF